MITLEGLPAFVVQLLHVALFFDVLAALAG